MTHAKRKIAFTSRRRPTRRGTMRLEVQVRHDDAALVRRVAEALADPLRGDDARSLLLERFGTKTSVGLKSLLAAAPLEGVDLERARDVRPDIDL